MLYEVAGDKITPLISVISHAVNSRSSSSSKYDPEILKAEIVTAKSRVRNSPARPFLLIPR